MSKKKKKDTYSYVVLDGCLPCRWFDDTPEGMQEAQKYVDYCNRNYVGHFTLRKMKDKDTLGFIKEVTTDMEKARAYACLNNVNQRW